MLYSGDPRNASLPERVLAQHSPGVMLSFYDLAFRSDAMKRFVRHENRCRAKWLAKRGTKTRNPRSRPR